MATALIRGMLRAGTAAAAEVCASDPVEEARAALARATGVAVLDSNTRAAYKSDVLVLADRCLQADSHIQRRLALNLVLESLAHDLGKLLNVRA